MAQIMAQIKDKIGAPRIIPLKDIKISSPWGPGREA
jgi:hypothetical protein